MQMPGGVPGGMVRVGIERDITGIFVFLQESGLSDKFITSHLTWSSRGGYGSGSQGGYRGGSGGGTRHMSYECPKGHDEETW